MESFVENLRLSIDRCNKSIIQTVGLYRVGGMSVDDKHIARLNALYELRRNLCIELDMLGCKRKRVKESDSVL